MWAIVTAVQTGQHCLPSHMNPRHIFRYSSINKYTRSWWKFYPLIRWIFSFIWCVVKTSVKYTLYGEALHVDSIILAPLEILTENKADRIVYLNLLPSTIIISNYNCPKLQGLHTMYIEVDLLIHEWNGHNICDMLMHFICLGVTKFCLSQDSTGKLYFTFILNRCWNFLMVIKKKNKRYISHPFNARGTIWASSAVQKQEFCYGKV